MRIDVHFTPLGLAPGDVSGRPVIVIDVLRATTTIVTALGHGARAVIPAASPEEAVRLASHLEKNDILLAGERKSLKIEGFNLGNSPREMTPEAVAGKTIVLATTNGTPALVAAAGGEPVLVGAAANFRAVAERARALLADGKDLVVLCSGRERQFALEDAYTAGRLIKAAKKGLKKVELNDAGLVSVALSGVYENWVEAFDASAAARQLTDVDLSADVGFAAKPDRFAVVPQYVDRRIT
jgi:2-phosphosulfolactate phosphatase